ncbi:MAG: glycosyltransferase family 4 protein [Lachnospiraceae bacterium]|nr:glycosyltransferase family 4 protein [Lachnospiraceae bacterium]
MEDKAKKILIITTAGGFLPQFEMNDVKILAEQGYEIHYASNFDNPVYEMDIDMLEKLGLRLHPISIPKSPIHIRRGLKAFREISSIIRQEEITALHCHNPMGGVLGRLAAFVCGAGKSYVIYTAHGFHFYKGAPFLNWLLFYPAEWLLAMVTDCLITINREDDKRAVKFLHGRLRSAYRIPGVGVDTKKFAPDRNMRRQMRHQLQIADNTFYILSVGEVNRNKNHEVIIRALAELGDSAVFYGICGRGYRQEYLEKLAKKLGVEKQVKFYGFRKDIPQMLQAADCFVFPSKREGLGIAAVEAMAAGLPMITSDCRGTREYMEDGVTGYVCSSGKAAAYAELIRRMKESPAQRKIMSAACRSVAEKFDIKKTDKIMREIYKQLRMH